MCELIAINTRHANKESNYYQGNYIILLWTFYYTNQSYALCITMGDSLLRLSAQGFKNSEF